MNGLRRPIRSLYQPIQSLMKLEVASATPSMRPSVAAELPRLAKNMGRITVVISWLMSEKRLVKPIPKTEGVSQLTLLGERPLARGLGKTCHFMRITGG